MGKFFKSINELNEEELESRESLAYAIGDNIGGAIRSLITPAFVMTGAVLFATPAAIAIGLSCLALSIGISMAEHYLLDLPQKLANPYRHALWELQDDGLQPSPIILWFLHWPAAWPDCPLRLRLKAN
jgi:hypothetical protein